MNQQTVSSSNFKGIYLLPNVLTTLALCCGFIAIALAIQGAHASAAKAIFLAMIADGLDGRVARLTDTQSEFGKQYDSLSDMVAFGVAPAVMLLTGALNHLGHIGWALAFVYAAFTAIRLARFNLGEASKDDFIGLPCPSAAALLSATLWVLHGEPFTVLWVVILSGLSLVLGVLMVSSVTYPSFKHIDFQNQYSKLSVCIIVGLCAAVVMNPPWVLWGIFTAYVLYGPVRWGLRCLGWWNAH